MQLGITRDAILFMDDETKEITKEVRLSHLRRWAPAPTTITLDFGDHDSEYSIMETSEGEAISALIAGYIDILMRRRKGKFLNIEKFLIKK
jgi:talin